MNAKKIIEIIKQKTGATDEELKQKELEVKQRYGPVIQTRNFLYYRIAVDCYHIDVPGPKSKLTKEQKEMVVIQESLKHENDDKVAM